MKESDEFVLFYGGPFSQWCPSVFELNGLRYNCTEQWMMACKARLFGDTESEKAIMQSTKPWDQKAIGRKVNNFVQDGLAENDPKALDRKNWRGTNWLGEVLTELRDEYKLGQKVGHYQNRPN